MNIEAVAKRNLQRKFEVICAELAPFEDIFFVFSKLIISKFTSWAKFPRPDIISHNVAISRLLRQLVTGGASFELEKSLAEGAGLRGGDSTPDTLVSQENTERLHSELKCSVQSPTQTERRDNFKDNPK